MNFDEAYTRLVKSAYVNLVRPILFRLGGGDPEVAHQVTINLLAGLPDVVWRAVDLLFNYKSDPVSIAGISFPGRVGVAAGVDKDGHALRAWPHLGMGFVELGTVTPRPQPGSPQPRMFRLRDSHAVINRMGFNNQGAKALARLLRESGLGSSGEGKLEQQIDIPVGVSIGKNRVTPLERAVADYLACTKELTDVADYLAVNVSSPNTPGLRQLQSASSLTQIAKEVVGAAEGTPVFVKLSPDMSWSDFDQVIDTCEDCGVSALIATNTTLNREGIAYQDRHLANQVGGLSGAPLTSRALEVVNYIAQRTSLPVIGAGGIMSPADAGRMFDAGVQLVQIYTGFIYSGPALAHGINRLTNLRRHND